MRCPGVNVVTHEGQVHEGLDMEQDPDGLRPGLEGGDFGEAMDHQWYHHQRADDVAYKKRYPEAEFQRKRQNSSLNRKEDKGK